MLFLNTSSLDCLDPYDECFDIEEKKRFDASVLKYVVNEMEKIHHDFGELRECPFYCNLIGCFNEDGWIARDSTIRLLAIVIFDLGQIEKTCTIFFY